MPGYDAFISYSHAADSRLAPTLQRALQRFAKPWWKLRALNLFRDETSLAAASSLTGALLAALESSRHFILLASPRAAASRWCNEEAAFWLRQRSSQTLLIVLSEGTIAWDETAGDFDWSRTDALPPALRGALNAEPLWIDVSWARGVDQLSERDPRFQQAVARLAATLHGRSLEDISGDDVRQHRRTRQVATGAVAAIALLAIGAGAAAWEATQARDEAQRERAAAVTNAAEAERQKASAERSEAQARAQRDTAEKALAQTLDAADTLVREIAEGMRDFAGVPRARLYGVLEKAERILGALPADDASAAVEKRKFQMLLGFADSMIVLGDMAQAERRARAAEEIARRQMARQPADVEWQYDLTLALARIGDARMARGDLAGALQVYEASHAIRQKLADGDPRNPRWQDGLANGLEKTGDIHIAQGAPALALKAYQAYLALADKRVDRQPSNMGWQRDLSVAHNKVGDAQVAMGDYEGALRSYEAGKVIAARVAQSDPLHTGWQRDLAVSHSKVGEIQMAMGMVGLIEMTVPMTSFQAARTIVERLTQSDPRNTGWQNDLAVILDKVGNIQLFQRDPKSARQSYEGSRAIFERLAQADPANANWQRQLAISLDKVGDAQASQEETTDAMRSYEAAREIRERLVKTDTRNATWQGDLVMSYLRLGSMLEHTPGRLEDGIRTLRMGLSIVEKLASGQRLEPRAAGMLEVFRLRLKEAEAKLAAGER